MEDNGFSKRQTDDVPFYVCRALESVPHLRHGFSTRAGGVSLPSGWLNLSRVPWDSPESVKENRRRFLSAIGVSGFRLETLSQVHSDMVRVIENTYSEGDRRVEGDALVTALNGVAVAVQVADCFPILIADVQIPAVAAIHAGWRGTLARILLKTVRGMQAAFDCRPAELLVAIGPGIRSCCFEVGQEVVDLYRQGFPKTDLAGPRPSHKGKYLMDLPAALDVQIREAGVDRARVFDLGLCTCCHADEFFSYRRDGALSGRMMGAIARVPPPPTDS